MRPLLKTLLLVLGIAALALLVKGFPQLRALLKVFLHPIGLIALGVLGFLVYRLRTRPQGVDSGIIDNSPKRIAPPKEDKEHV
ncbi:MAG: hypothetical protein ACYST0_00735 [Planctomycetota bacterium]|jgi:hypothetical protein